MAGYYGVNGKRLQEQYKSYLSDFRTWSQLNHAKDWLIFPQNIGKHLSIDETSLSDGELYTILTNKAANCKKGSIVALVAGTKAETVIDVLRKIPVNLRKRVKEITLDMAANMELIAKRAFPNATRVTDRFHVQQLATEALQEIRIKHRWEALDAENDAIELAKKTDTEYISKILPNGDTVKQLLARSRYALYKKETDWTENQKQRATLLFDLYPDIKQAYDLTMSLSYIFENTNDKLYGLTRLARWHEKVRQAGFKSFNTVARSIQNHYKTIVNFFENRSTNASAESFNAKVKAFRSQFRGVKNIPFFLYRLTQIYA
ncbi:transposase [Emticicia sp. 21SJ11W-3]|uniref:ISAon1 family transposase n=1 Tax=Emticicia sp. 21SJ11W-3 TaxID=2916755 RepID=UPI0020A00730|nr:transposase [Emticicia sp. 21SJ11W-3]UTA70402.1 transposase [Emticicia sp. 21SJ11W-3]